jgi:predicted dehydrogenase
MLLVQALHSLASVSSQYFQVNHSANWRKQTQKAKQLIDDGVIGEVRHIVTSMGSPLQHLFEDPHSGSWIRLPNGEMSGFGWGQLSHTIAWVLLVTGVVPETAFCFMTPSTKSGADIYNAGTIRCTNGCLISISGTATTSPAYSATVGQDSDNITTKIRNGKHIDNKIFGSEGMLLYSGDDADASSGSLSVSRLDGSVNEAYPELGGFLFENTAHAEAGGMPESLESFVDACNGLPYWSGAPSSLGLLVVRTVDALYRSARSCLPEDV